MINILIVDDHEVVGEGTKQLLSEVPEFNVEFVQCSSSVIAMLKEKKYDVYIFDLNMPEKNGLELTKNLLSVQPDAKVLIFTGHDIATHSNYIIDSGVSGFVSKLSSKAQLIRSIWCTLEGQAILPIELLSQLRKTTNELTLTNGKKVSLSEKEEVILVKVSMGKNNDEIAEELYMSRRNVERHLTNIFKQFNVNSRAEAIVKAKSIGALPDGILS